MQKEKQNKQNKPGEEKKEGYIIIPNYFLREYIKVLGVGPAMFYQYLLTYCHKNKKTAWPSLSTSSKDTGITKKTLIKYYRILTQYGLIKKISKKKLSSDGYMRNIYQLTPLDGEKITLHRGNFYHNIGVKITPDLGKKLHPNNTNLNSTNTTTKDVVVNFKKIKEKGEKKMQEVRERMQELDFTKSFTEKVLTEYPLKKIEEKLEMYAEGKQVRNPVGWLMAALKNDYQGEERERYDEEPVERENQPIPHPHLNPPPSRGRRKEMDSRFRGNDIKESENDIKESCNDIKSSSDSSGLGNLVSAPEWTSREKALEAIGLIRDNLSLSVYPLSPQGREPG